MLLLLLLLLLLLRVSNHISPACILHLQAALLANGSFNRPT